MECSLYENETVDVMKKGDQLQLAARNSCLTAAQLFVCVLKLVTEQSKGFFLSDC